MNVVLLSYRFVGNKVVVCVTEKVKAGQEINNSYGKDKVIQMLLCTETEFLQGHKLVG